MVVGKTDPEIYPKNPPHADGPKAQAHNILLKPVHQTIRCSVSRRMVCSLCYIGGYNTLWQSLQDKVEGRSYTLTNIAFARSRLLGSKANNVGSTPTSVSVKSGYTVLATFQFSQLIILPLAVRPFKSTTQRQQPAENGYGRSPRTTPCPPPIDTIGPSTFNAHC